MYLPLFLLPKQSQNSMSAVLGAAVMEVFAVEPDTFVVHSHGYLAVFASVAARIANNSIKYWKIRNRKTFPQL